jgi:hypothetical protein
LPDSRGRRCPRSRRTHQHLRRSALVRVLTRTRGCPVDRCGTV